MNQIYMLRSANHAKQSALYFDLRTSTDKGVLKSLILSRKDVVIYVQGIREWEHVCAYVYPSGAIGLVREGHTIPDNVI